MNSYFKFSLLIFFSLSLLLIPALSLATEDEETVSPFSTVEGILGWLRTVTNWVFVFTLVIAVIMFIYAGFTLVTASGDTQKIDQAKSIILYGILGVAVVLLAATFISLTLNITGSSANLPFSE